MKKTLLSTSAVVMSAIAVLLVVSSVGAITDTVISGGKPGPQQPALAAAIDEASVNFDANDVDSLRSALNVIYTNKHGQRIAVFGYGISASVQDGVCFVHIGYNGLTTTVKFNLPQKSLDLY